MKKLRNAIKEQIGNIENGGDIYQPLEKIKQLVDEPALILTLSDQQEFMALRSLLTFGDTKALKNIRSQCAVLSDLPETEGEITAQFMINLSSDKIIVYWVNDPEEENHEFIFDGNNTMRNEIGRWMQNKLGMLVEHIKAEALNLERCGSQKLGQIGDYFMWESKGDILPFWISDKDGHELFSYKDQNEMIVDLKEIWQRHKALKYYLNTAEEICVIDNPDEFCTDCGRYEVVTMNTAISNESYFLGDRDKDYLVDLVGEEHIGSYTRINNSKYFVREL